MINIKTRARGFSDVNSVDNPFLPQQKKPQKRPLPKNRRCKSPQPKFPQQKGRKDFGGGKFAVTPWNRYEPGKKLEISPFGPPFWTICIPGKCKRGETFPPQHSPKTDFKGGLRKRKAPPEGNHTRQH